MDTVANTLPRFERSGFATAALATGVVLFLVGVAPRSERALFLKDDARLPAKAFSAVVPPLDPTRAQLERSLLNAIASRSSRSGEGLTSPANRQFVASNQGLLPGTLPTLLSTGNAPGALPVAGDSTPPSGAPSAPTGGQPGGTSPTTPGTTPGTSPTTPGTTPTAPGLPGPSAGAPGTGTPTDQPPVSAVPEPASWAMMLLGFLAIGWAARRRPRKLLQAS